MQHRKATLSAALLLLCWFSECAAQYQSNNNPGRCNDTVLGLAGKHFQVGNFSYPKQGSYPSAENGGVILAGVCTIWPANNSRIIAAFAYDNGVRYEKQLLLAMIDVPAKRIIASYKGVIPEDAATEVNSYSLVLDVARYTLSKTTRAFGVRQNSFRDRCTYEGGSDNQLTLFVVDGKLIRPVFVETMSHWSFGDGNRCGGGDVPRKDAGVSISVEPTSTNGFSDLRLTAKRSDKKTPVSAVVKYNGNEYDLKPWSNAFYAWWE